MTKQEIIEKIKLAEDISLASKKFSEPTYKIVLSLLLFQEDEKKDFQEKEAKIKGSKKAKQEGVKNKTNTGLSAKIDDLVDSGFFNQKRTNKEIVDKLRLLGYKMPSTSLPSYLLPRIRKGELFREEIQTKGGKIYGYIKAQKK